MCAAAESCSRTFARPASTFTCRCQDDRVEFTFRWRPPLRERVAAIALRERFVLLARCALLQYPALWSAGQRGRVPLHASACSVDGACPLFVAAGGIGRSTLVHELSLAGHVTTGDNLVVGDGTVSLGTGRAAPDHGRRWPANNPWAARDRRSTPGLVTRTGPDRRARAGNGTRAVDRAVRRVGGYTRDHHQHLRRRRAPPVLGVRGNPCRRDRRGACASARRRRRGDVRCRLAVLQIRAWRRGRPRPPAARRVGRHGGRRVGLMTATTEVPAATPSVTVLDAEQAPADRGPSPIFVRACAMPISRRPRSSCRTSTRSRTWRCLRASPSRRKGRSGRR